MTILQWATLQFSDGTTSVSLLKGKLPGFHLKEWKPKIIQPKGGGVFQDSSLAAGRRLVNAVDASATETFTLLVNHYNPDLLAQEVQNLLRLLLKARAYWVSDFQDEPVYLKAVSQRETNPRYCVVNNWSMSEIDDPYNVPFGELARRIIAMDNLTLTIERGHWLGNAPGGSSCVQTSTQTAWAYSYPVTQVSSTPTSYVTEFVQHGGSSAVYAMCGEDRIMKSTDGGSTWSNNLTGAPLGTTSAVVCGCTLTNNYILVGGIQGNGTPLVRTTNDGTSWSDVSVAAMSEIYSIVQASNGNVVATGYTTTGYGAAWLSTDNGGTWTLSLTGMGGGAISSARVASNGTIIASGYAGFYWASTNNGSTWVFKGRIGNGALLDVKKIFVASDGYMYAHSRDTGFRGHIYRSTDNGSTWSAWYLSTTLMSHNIIEVGSNGTFYAISSPGVGITSLYLLKSTDYGLSWQSLKLVLASAYASDYVRMGLFYTSGSKLLIGTGYYNSTGYIHTLSNPTSTNIGRAATCNKEIYVSNRGNLANLTHIYIDDGGSFTNIFPASLPVTLFPATPANNDALYFGVNTSNINGGPFGGLVFDLSTPMTGVFTITWQYYNGSWTTLNTSNPDVLSTSGVTSIHWQQPSDWTTTSVNSVTGYWIRALISGISGTVTPPVQRNRDIYAITTPFVNIDDAQVTGDIPSVARCKIYNVSDLDGPSGSAPDLYANRVLVGLRSYNRGSSFTPYLNIADSQNYNGIFISLGTNTSFVSDSVSPSGRYAQYNPAGVESMATRATITISPSIASEFYGTYHAFLRGQRSAGSSTDITVRLQISSGSGGLSFTTISRQFQTTTAFEVLDFGQITLPVSGSFKSTDLGDSTSITIQASAASGTPNFNMYDLVLLPVDEWAGSFVDVTNTTMSEIGRSNNVSKYLDIDSVTDQRTDIKSLIRTTDGDFITSEYRPEANGEMILQANADQRLWFFAMQTSATGSSYSWLAPPEIVHSVQLYATPRYLALRGER